MKKIKILHILYFARIAGAEIYVHLLTEKMDKTTFENTVCFMHKKDIMVDRLEQSGIPVKVIGMSSGVDIFKALSLYRFIKKEKFDIIHVHLPSMIGCAVSVFSSKNVIYHEHTPGTHFQRRKIFMPFIFSKLKKIIAVSNNVKDNLMRHNSVPEDKVYVRYNGIDLKKFQISFDKNVFKDSLGIDKHKTIIGFVGRLEKGKGVDMLLDALDKVKRNFRDFHLLIIGVGAKRAELEKIVHSKKLEKHVTFMGQRDDIAR